MAGMTSSGVRNDVLLPDAVRVYVKEHKLESIVTKSLNRIIQEMPEDPYAGLAQLLSQSSTSAPRLAALRPDATVPREKLCFDIVVATRGVRVRIYSLNLEDSLKAIPEPKDGEEAADEAPPAETDSKKKVQELEKLISFLQDFFVKAFGDTYVDDYLSFHERCAGLSAAPLPGGVAVDIRRATVSMTNQLLDASLNSLKLTPLAFLQRALSQSGCELVSPPLRDPRDYTLWRSRWPQFSMPIFHGGGPSILRAASFRCGAVFSPFVVAPAPIPSATAEEETKSDKPEPGWISAVVENLRNAQAEAVKSLQADKATASMVVDGLAYAPPGGLLQTVQMAEKAAEAALLAVGGNIQASSGLLFAYAEEAWMEEEQVYEVETGKQISLEELVELYAEAAESGWLGTIVNPFRKADVQAGCELLKARKPELKLIQDFGAEAKPEEPDENSAFGCMWHLPETLPLILKQYAETAPIWQEKAHGFGGCTVLTSAIVTTLPAIMEALMACSEVQTICISHDMSAEVVQQLSERNDAMLQRIELVKVPDA